MSRIPKPKKAPCPRCCYCGLPVTSKKQQAGYAGYEEQIMHIRCEKEVQGGGK